MSKWIFIFIPSQNRHTSKSLKINSTTFLAYGIFGGSGASHTSTFHTEAWLPKIAKRNNVTIPQLLMKYHWQYLGISFLTTSRSEGKLVRNMCSLGGEVGSEAGVVSIPDEDYGFILDRAVTARMKTYRPDPAEIL